jgi:RNA polymerase sigma-70 factor (ECF subfamily)
MLSCRQFNSGASALPFHLLACFAVPCGSSAPSSLNERDEEDVKGSLNGDGDAYRRLVERHQERIGRQMWRFSRDLREHEELVQDVFVEAYRSLHSYGSRAAFEHWLARIATRVGYRFWKNQARQRMHVPLEEWDQLPDDSAGEWEPEEAAQILHELMAQLPPRDRLVLSLRYIDEKSVKETAELTGWSQSMVKVQIWRARKKLQNLYPHSERRRKDV